MTSGNCARRWKSLSVHDYNETVQVMAKQIADAIHTVVSDNNISYVNNAMKNATITQSQIKGGIGVSKVNGFDTVAAKIANAKIHTAEIDWAQIVNADIKYADIEEATIELLKADAVTAVTLEAQKITTNELKAAIASIAAAQITTANIDHANINWAEVRTLESRFANIDMLNVKDLQADEAIISKGIGRQIFISRLAVSYAQMVSATVGELIIKASNGTYWKVDVDTDDQSSDFGKVIPTRVYPTESEIESGHTEDRVILGTSITAEELATTDIFATFALMDEITAHMISVDQLFARQATIDQLNAYDITGNEHIGIAVVGGVENSGITLDEDGIRIKSTADIRIDSASKIVIGSGTSSTTLNDELMSKVTELQNEYCQSDSATTPGTSPVWSTTAPVKEDGKYIWCRTKYVAGGTTYYKPNANGTCISGYNGYNTATLYIYKRSDTTITGVGFTNTTHYTFSDNSYSTYGGWSSRMPINDGKKYLYVSTCVATSTDDEVDIAWNKWSSPTVVSYNGKDGSSVSILGSYDTVEELIEEHPTGNVGDAYIVGEDLYVWDPDAGEWHNAGRIRGDDGAPGLNCAVVTLYRRYTTEPQKPTENIEYEFSSGAVRGSLNNWTKEIPATTEDRKPCWVIQASAVSSGTTDTITPGEWTEHPVKMLEDGIGIKSITPEYYLSTSSVSPTGGSWSESRPVWEPDHYYFTREHLVWDDNTDAYTDPVYDEGLTSSCEDIYETAGKADGIIGGDIKAKYARAMSGIAMEADEDTGIDLLSGGVINIGSGADVNIAAGGKMEIMSGGEMTIVNSGGNNAIEMNNDGIAVLSEASIDVKSGGDINVESGGSLHINANDLHLGSNRTLVDELESKSKVYYQEDDPAILHMSELRNGDRWVRVFTETNNELNSYTNEALNDTDYDNDLLSGPAEYEWNDFIEEWIEVSNLGTLYSQEISVDMMGDRLRSAVEEIIVVDGRVTENKSVIEQSARRISGIVSGSEGVGKVVTEESKIIIEKNKIDLESDGEISLKTNVSGKTGNAVKLNGSGINIASGGNISLASGSKIYVLASDIVLGNTSLETSLNQKSRTFYCTYSNLPQTYQVGDIWYDTGNEYGYQYVCNTQRSGSGKSLSDWSRIGSSVVSGAKLNVDAENGNIELVASNTISATSNGSISIASGDNISITTLGTITLGSGSSPFIIGKDSQNRSYIRNGMTEFADTTNDGIYLGTDGIALGKGNFSVSKSGNLISKTGTIGGWTISSTKLFSGSGINGVTLDAGTAGENYAIWAGANTSSSAPFRVKRDGTVVLTMLERVKTEGGTETEKIDLRANLWKMDSAYSNSVTGGDLQDGTLYLYRPVGDPISIPGFNKAVDGVSIDSFTASDYSSEGTYVVRDILLWNGTELVGTIEDFQIGVNGYKIAANVDGWNDARSHVSAPSYGEGTSFVFTCPSTTYKDSTDYTFTIAKGSTPSSNGYASVSLSGVLVGRIQIGDWFTAGFNSAELESSWSGRTFSYGIVNTTKTGSVTIGNATQAAAATYNSTTKTYTIPIRNSIGATSYLSNNIDFVATAAYNDGYSDGFDSAELESSWGGRTFTYGIKDTSKTGSVTIGNAEQASAATYNEATKTYTIPIRNSTGSTTYLSNNIQFVATDAYNSGFNAVTVSAGGWSGGYNVVTASNGETVQIGLPTITVTASPAVNHKYTVNATGGGAPGSLGSTVVDATVDYNSGYNIGYDTGYDEGEADVTISGAWSGATYTATASNTKSASTTVSVKNPTISYRGMIGSTPTYSISYGAQADGTDISASYSGNFSASDAYEDGEDSVTLSQGSWSSGSMVVSATNGKTTTVNIPAITLTTPTLSGTTYSFTVSCGGRTLPSSINASAVYNNGYSDGEDSVTLSQSGWASGVNTISASNGESITLTILGTDISMNVTGPTSAHQYRVTATCVGVSNIATIDAADLYNSAWNSGGATAKLKQTGKTLDFNEEYSVTAQYVNASGTTVDTTNTITVTAPSRPTVNSLSSVVLSSTDVGQSTKDVTVFYDDDEEEDTTITINAANVYSAGQDSVTLTSGGWVGGYNTVTASNGKTIQVGLPTITVTASAPVNHKYTVNATGGGAPGSLGSTIVDATVDYNSGYSSGHTDGYSEGKADVTISGAWSGSTYTATASNSKSVSTTVSVTNPTITYSPIGSTQSYSISFSANAGGSARATYTGYFNATEAFIAGMEAGGNEIGLVVSGNTISCAISDVKSIAITSGAGITYDTTTHKYTATATAYAGDDDVDADEATSGTEAYDDGEESVTISSGTWSSGSMTVTASNGKTITVNIPAITLTQPTLSGVVYSFTISCGGRTLSTTINAQTVYNNGYSAGEDSVTLSAGGWISGVNRVTASNDEYVDVTLPTITLTSSAPVDNIYTIIASGGGSSSLATLEIDASDIYDDGADSVTLSQGTWSSGSMVVSATNGKTTTVNIPTISLTTPTLIGTTYSFTVSCGGKTLPSTINAQAVYNNGYSDGEDSVTIEASGWAVGSNTISASNGESITLTILGSDIGMTVTGPTSANVYRVTASCVGVSNFVNVDASDVYDSGYDSGTGSVAFSGETAWTSGIKTITLTNNKSKTISIPTVTINRPTGPSADHKYTVTATCGGRTSAETTIDATSVFNSVTVSAGTWADGSMTVSASNGNTVSISIPTISISTPTLSGTTYSFDISCGGKVQSETINASVVYNNGYSDGFDAVTVSSGTWSGGYNTVTASNGKSVQVGLPTISVVASAPINHKYTVNATGGGAPGSLGSTTVDATVDYDAGYAAGYEAGRNAAWTEAHEGSSAVREGRVITATYPSATYGAFTQDTFTVMADAYVNLSLAGIVVTGTAYGYAYINGTLVQTATDRDTIDT